MSSFFRPLWAFCVRAFCVIALITSPSARAVELIANGGFETGDFTGWTVADLPNGEGSWFIDDSDGLTPSSNLSTVGPAAGDFYAVSDQTGPGTHALIQSFVIPGAASSVILSYDMFVQTDAAPTVDPIGLDHTGPSNQHARVDILTTSATDFDTTSNVLASLYSGIDGTIPQNYVSYSHDVTSIVGAGGVFQLRFAETDNIGYFHQGVDNVSIDFTPVPEPTALLMAGVALLVGTCCRRAKR